MKIYLVSYKGKPNIAKMEAWSIINKVGENGIYVESINAFLRKKDAKRWIKDGGWGHFLEVKTAQII